METFDTSHHDYSQGIDDSVILRPQSSLKKASVRDRLKTNPVSSMETYVRDEIRLRSYESMKGICNQNKVCLKNFEETEVGHLTINYSLSEMTTTLLDNFVLSTASTVSPFSVIHNFSTNYSRYITKHTVVSILLSYFKASLSSCARTQTGLTAQNRLQCISLRSRLLNHSVT